MPFGAPFGVPRGVNLRGHLSPSLANSIVSSVFTASGKQGAGFPSLQRDGVLSFIFLVPRTSVYN